MTGAAGITSIGRTGGCRVSGSGWYATSGRSGSPIGCGDRLGSNPSGSPAFEFTAAGPAAASMLGGLMGGRSGGGATDMLAGLLGGGGNNSAAASMLGGLLGGNNGGAAGNMLGLLLGSAPTSSRASNVAGILGHMLGGQTTPVQQGISKALGLDAIEVYHYRLDRRQRRHFHMLARMFKLPVSGGSDTHDNPETSQRFATEPVTSEMLEVLRSKAESYK